MIAFHCLETVSEPLNPAGWLFMIVSVGFVTTLAIWCFKRVLSAPKDAPKQAEDFHSA